jgi:hypothetical protein
VNYEDRAKEILNTFYGICGEYIKLIDQLFQRFAFVAEEADIVL